jgi:hypothetical protein
VPDPPEFILVLVRKLVRDAVLLSSGDLMLCYPPIPGTGDYTASAFVRLSVLFWRGEFWVPVLGSRPGRLELAEEVYGLEYGGGKESL